MTAVGVDADEPWPSDAVEVGRIADAWGVKGWFKVLPHAAEPQALLSSRRWFLRRPATAAARVAPPHCLSIRQARAHGEFVVAQANEVPDRPTAEALRGATVFVSRARFPAPAADEYYWVDLIGLEVVNRAGEPLGRVTDLLDTGAHSVLRVVDDAGAPGQRAERLIPFVASYVDAVDIPGRTIRVDWGLDY